MSWITDIKDQLESKIDSTLSKVEGLMAKSGEIEKRFNKIDNIHQAIKGSMLKFQQNLNGATSNSKGVSLNHYYRWAKFFGWKGWKH